MNNATPSVILFTQHFVLNVVVVLVVVAVVVVVVIVVFDFYRFVLPNCEAKLINCSNFVLLSRPSYCC